MLVLKIIEDLVLFLLGSRIGQRNIDALGLQGLLMIRVVDRLLANVLHFAVVERRVNGFQLVLLFCHYFTTVALLPERKVQVVTTKADPVALSDGRLFVLTVKVFFSGIDVVFHIKFII